MTVLFCALPQHRVVECPFEVFTARVLDLHRPMGDRYAPERLCTCGQYEDACVYLGLAAGLLDVGRAHTAQ